MFFHFCKTFRRMYLICLDNLFINMFFSFYTPSAHISAIVFFATHSRAFYLVFILNFVLSRISLQAFWPSSWISSVDEKIYHVLVNIPLTYKFHLGVCVFFKTLPRLYIKRVTSLKIYCHKVLVDSYNVCCICSSPIQIHLLKYYLFGG